MTSARHPRATIPEARLRVLLITSPSTTHFLPMVPLAWALRAAGHEVLVAAQPDVLDAVAGAGLNAVPTGRRAGIDDAMRELLFRPGLRPFACLGRWTPEMLAVFPPVWQRHSADVLPRYLELARTLRPDLIVCDVMEFNAPVVGAELGIPVVRHRYGVDPLLSGIAPAARDALRPLHQELGLGRLPEPTAVLDPCPAALQLPDIAPGRPVRYVPYNGSGVLPDWLRAERQAGAPPRRVLVSLGSHTLALNGVPLLRGILAAAGAGHSGVEVLATVPRAYRAELGPVPDTVRLIDPLPLHLIAGDCAAVVHHGGAGTGMTAAVHGVPQLVLPQFADAFAFAERLSAVGAGLAVDTVEQQDDPEFLRTVLEKLLGDASYEQAAGRLGRAMAEMPPPAALVPELERIAAGAPI
ncbi:nucleotide disphospho-sugar-binding domain-containing protein [Streptomyces sp. NPDC057555]|uniref:nucleotide disphospho-sugar-binding domain-containing protein n=1 Tax=Streptomyces sp. NPDC057555 TaxID=3346166 RepID=UPI0036A4C9DC